MFFRPRLSWSHVFHLSAALLFGVVFSGCSSRESAVVAGNRTQTLHVNNSAEPRDLDPHTTTIPADINVIRAIMEGLCEVDPITCQPIPGVAATWSVSPDGLTWTFHLRLDARWSNNEPVTAHDFVYAYRRILAPALGAEFRDQFHILKNAEAYATGKLTDFNAVGVRAIDDHTLMLTLHQPVPYLPTLVTQICWYPLHRATITGSYVGWGTGGHTDEFVRFADARTVLLAWADETEARQHPVARLNQRRMEINFDILSGSTDQNGKPLRVIKVPLPRTIERPVVLSAGADTAYSAQWTAASFPLREGRREGATVQQVATSSYLNHVLANGLVLLPDYVAHGTPAQRQDQVCEIYQSVFPGCKIQLINAVNANWTGGGAHCATLSEPAVPA